MPHGVTIYLFFVHCEMFTRFKSDVFVNGKKTMHQRRRRKSKFDFFFITLQEIKGTAHTPVMPCIAKKSDYLYRKYF